MGFLDKVKNLFTEEEEVYEEPIKKEVIKVEIPAPEVAKEEPKEKEVVKPEVKKEPVIVEPKKEEPKKPAPVFFDDKDFENIERRVAKPKSEPKKKKEEEPKRVAYQMSKQRLHEEKKSFKPSPIISPVYGVLDKNYHKDDIVPKREFRTDRVGGELTIDDVRNKAYGTLEDDIDATLFETKKEEEKKAPMNGLEDDIFKDLELDMEKDEMTMDSHVEVEDDAEFQLDEPKKEDENLVEEAMNMEEETPKKERKRRATPEEDTEDDLDDSDLFHLIDSFYEKRDEEE